MIVGYWSNPSIEGAKLGPLMEPNFSGLLAGVPGVPTGTRIYSDRKFNDNQAELRWNAPIPEDSATRRPASRS